MAVYTKDYLLEKMSPKVVKMKEYKDAKKVTIANLHEAIRQLENDTFVGALYVNQLVKGKKNVAGFHCLFGDIGLIDGIIKVILNEFPDIFEQMSGIPEDDHIGVG